MSIKSSARDVFSYLLLIITLIIGVTSFLTLIFQYVNIQFPDQLELFMREGSLYAIRAAISALVISWPTAIFMSMFIGRDLRGDASKQNIWIRKWLLHLMLFVAALTIIIDLITLINTYLGGEITTRFILKVVSVLIVAVAVFWYYLWELKRDPIKPTKISILAAVLSSTIILAGIIVSFFVIGSPSKQRDLRMDQNRISDLQTIQSNIVRYWQDKETLPENLTVLEDDLIGYRNPVDPETGEGYEYTQTGDVSFELCATFKAVSETSAEVYPHMYYEFGYSDSNFDIWSHEAGRVCFDRTIDPDRFKEDIVY